MPSKPGSDRSHAVKSAESGGLTRRSLLASGATLLALHARHLLSPLLAARPVARPRVAVVGAGAFGGWTALHLLRRGARDRKSTRLNSSHLGISYAVFCLKKKNTPNTQSTAGVRYSITPTISPSTSFSSYANLLRNLTRDSGFGKTSGDTQHTSSVTVYTD